MALINVPGPILACSAGSPGRSPCPDGWEDYLEELAEEYDMGDIEADDSGAYSDGDDDHIDDSGDIYNDSDSGNYADSDPFDHWESLQDNDDSFTYDFNFDEELRNEGGGDSGASELASDDIDIESDYSFDMNEGDFSSCDGGGCGAHNSINGFSGNMNLELHLFTLDTVGVPIPITLYYNSQAEMDVAPFGYGWKINWDISLDRFEFEDEEGEHHYQVRRMADGGLFYYEPYNNAWRPTEGHQGKLEHLQDDRWLETLKNGVKYYYSSSGRLESVENSHGNPVTFSYDTEGYIETISDSSGREIQFIRTGTKITSIVTPDPDLQEYVFSYVAGEMHSYTDPEESSVEFGYSADGRHRLTSRTYPSTGYYEDYAYNSDKVITKTRHNGNYVYHRHYQYSGPTTAVIDENGHKRVTKYNDSGQWVEQSQYGLVQGVFVSLATLKRDYGADGSLLWEEDGRGNRTLYEYDDNGNRTLMQVGIPDGQGDYTWGPPVTYSYYPQSTDGVWHLQTETNARGNAVSYIYYSNGDLKNKTWEVTDPDTDLRVRYSDTRSYGDNGLLSSYMDAGSNSTYYAYDTYGNLVAVSQPNGRRTEYSSDIMGRRTEERCKIDDTHFKVTEYERDDIGRVTKVTYNEDSSDYGQFEYSCCTLDSSRDRNGNITYYYYWPSGKLWQKLQRISDVNYVSTYYYDGLDQLTKETNARGKDTYYAYDGMGRKFSITNALNQVTSFGYDANSNLTSKTVNIDQRNISTTMTYDEYNRLTSVTNPIDPGTSAVTHYAYDAGGNLTTVTDAENRVKTMVYDEMGRVIRIEEPLNRTTNYRYNASGDLVKVIDALQRQTTFEYDGLHRLTHTYKPIDESRTLHIEKTYDKIGNETFVTLHDVIGTEDHTTEQQYDLDCRLVKKIDPEGKEISFEYYNGGELHRIVDDNGVVTHYDIDEVGRTKVITYAEGTADQRTEQFVYDGVGNLTSKTNRKGETITYTYDDIDRLDCKSRPDGKQAYYSYDTLGRMTSILMSGYGTITFDYDDFNRQSGVRDSGDRWVTYKYDKVGNRTSITYPGDTVPTVSYGYDYLNRIDWVNDTANNAIANYTYDPLRRTRLDLQNGTYTNYSSYNSADWITLMENRKSQSETISTFEYSYDRAGNRLDMKRDSLTDDYKYNKSYELVRVDYDPQGSFTSQTFNYDGVGNRTSVVNGGTTSYSHNPLNEYTSVGGTSYSYDLSGNLTTDGTQTYYYDCENQLTSARSNFNGQTIAEYRYDPMGRRYVKIVGANVTIYIMDGVREIEERNQSEMLRRFVFGSGIDEVLMMRKQNGTKYYYHYDALGSVANISDASKDVVKSYTYQAYGEYEESGSFTGNLRTFSGRYYDSEISLLNCRSRQYSTYLGRFIQTDPLFNIDGYTLYSYCYNRPTTFIDILGAKPGDPFTSERAAACDALAWSRGQTLSTGWEYGGEIFRVGDTWTYNSKTDNLPDEVRVFKTMDSTTAWYHSHSPPGGNVPFALPEGWNAAQKKIHVNLYVVTGNNRYYMLDINEYIKSGNFYGSISTFHCPDE